MIKSLKIVVGAAFCFFYVSCTPTNTQSASSNLDNRLFGIWQDTTTLTTNGYLNIYSFSDDGRMVYYRVDFDGNYSINAAEGQTIKLSYVGYESLTLKVSDGINFDISLKQSGALNEIVVTALGISREKKSLGYSVTEIDGDNVNTIKDNNLASSLTGKVAGLQVNSSGSLGSGSVITIRGNNSITGNTQALIVVDGMPINASIPITSDGGQANSGGNNNGD